MIYVTEGERKYEIPFAEGKNILELLQDAGIQSITAPCGGNGTCKKCNVLVHCKEFTGNCLSCLTPARDNMLVELTPEVRISFSDTIDAITFPADPGQTGYAVTCTRRACCLNKRK